VEYTKESSFIIRLWNTNAPFVKSAGERTSSIGGTKQEVFALDIAATVKENSASGTTAPINLVIWNEMRDDG
jgi:hypothetical protein